MFALPRPVSAAEAPSANTITLEGPNVINYGADDYVFSTSADYVLGGKPVGEGKCEFSNSGPIDQSEEITEIELAYDPDTCRMLIRRGVAIKGMPEPDGSGETQSSSSGALATPSSSGGTDVSGGTTAQRTTNSGTSGAPRARGGGGGDVSTAAVGYRAHYMWSWVDEPARWAVNCDVEDGPAQGCFLPPVNTVKNTVEYVADPTCTAAPGSTAFFGYQATWFKGSGWRLLRNDFAHNGPVLGCTETLFSRNVNHFQNSLFCQALYDFVLPGFLTPKIAPTNTYYDPNHVSVTNSDSVTYSWRTTKDGGCQSFLRQGRRFGTGLG